MDFSLREFVLCGFKDAIGKQADHWVILNSSLWMEKGVLTSEDLEELNALIIEKNTREAGEGDAEGVSLTAPEA